MSTNVEGQFVSPNYAKPNVSRSSTIEDVLGRMYNWKMGSALYRAKEVPNFPKEALTILEELAEKFGNCGWGSGVVYNVLSVNNDKVAEILGYEWNDAEDFWLSKNCG